MSQTIRAHFDGRTIVPDEPLDLAAGEEVEVTVTRARAATAEQRRQPEPGSIGETLLRFVESQPPLDRGNLPTDQAKNYKHYLYGHPKQP